MRLVIVQALLAAFRNPHHLVLRLRPDFPNAGLALAVISIALRILANGIVGILVHQAGSLLEPLPHLRLGEPCSLRNPIAFLPVARWLMQEILAVGMIDANPLGEVVA